MRTSTTGSETFVAMVTASFEGNSLVKQSGALQLVCFWLNSLMHTHWQDKALSLWDIPTMRACNWRECTLSTKGTADIIREWRQVCQYCFECERQDRKLNNFLLLVGRIAKLLTIQGVSFSNVEWTCVHQCSVYPSWVNYIALSQHGLQQYAHFYVLLVLVVVSLFCCSKFDQLCWLLF